MAEKIKSNPEQSYRRARRRKTLDAAAVKEAPDPYLERNEFKPGFYDQPGDRPITPETYYGTASGKTMFEPEIMSPDDSMLVEYRKGGGLIAKGCGKVMKDRKKVTKMY
jgi:hypothetical protein